MEMADLSTNLRAPTTTSAIPDQRLICRVCAKNFSQYTCPRCNLRYCSLACYKGHSVRCTESFARENVLEEMKDMTVSSESKQRMQEALKRIHFDEEGRSIFEDDELRDSNEDEEDDEDTSGSEAFLTDATLQKFAGGGDISLEDLTPKEKRAFLRALAAGELSHFIQPWEPWWVHPLAHTISLTKHGTSLIHPTEGTEPTGVDSSSGTEMDSVSQAGESPSPAPPDKPLRSLKELTTVQPSPLLGVQVTEAIYGYCFTLRLFNGDWRTDPLDAALVLLRVSKSLGDAQSPQSMGAAMAGCLENVCSPAFKHHGGYRFGVGLFDDVVQLLCLKRAGVICALADMERLFETAKKDLKKEASAKSSVSRQFKTSFSGNRTVNARQKGRSSSSEHNLDVRRLQAAVKKVYFMMCWVNEQLNEAFVVLSGLVEKDKEIYPEGGDDSKFGNILSSSEASSVKKLAQQTPPPVKKPIIEEVG